MPFKKTRKTVRPVFKRKFVRKARVPRLVSTLSAQRGNVAQSVESHQITVDLLPNQAYALSTKLSEFPRSTAIAANYQWYRCTKLTFKYEPLYNLYQEGSGAVPASASVPQMYWIMNRNGTNPTAFGTGWLTEQGSKPIKFTKNITLKYKPNTLGIISLNGAPTGSVSFDKVFNKWINSYTDTGVNEVQNTITPFYGHCFIIEQELGGSQPVGKLTLEACWEFKEPYVAPPQVGQDGVSSSIQL